jgi:hypothetical protein
MGGSKAPAAPDYVGAAQAQGAADLQAAIATGKINNPTVNNPYGSQTVTWGGAQGTEPTINQTLSPEQKKIFDANNAAKETLSNAGITSANQVQSALGTPLDYSKLGPAPTGSVKARQDVIDAAMSRVNTDTAGQRTAKNSELIAAGIRPGTPAYETAMAGIDRQYNDARQQAILNATGAAQADYGIDQNARNQAIFEMMQQRQTPLNEVNALASGSQVNSPFSGSLGYQPGAQVGAAPVFNAQVQQGQANQNQYNQNQASYNSNVSAGAGLIGSLGSAALSR